MFRYLIIILGVSVACALILSSQTTSDVRRIGIVVPVEHRAMDEMIGGFKRVVGKEISITVKNAQGDFTLLQSIIESYKNQELDLVASIGTDVSLMTLSKIQTCPVIAMDVTEAVPSETPNVTGVLESDVTPSIEFLVEAFSELKKFTIIYSSSDKDFALAKRAVILANEKGIEVQELMVYTLADLYPMAQQIAKDSELIFILKDHLMASGIATLSAIAKERDLPLMTSDEGTVIKGGSFALGNRESEIGERAGEIALALLSGADAKEYPIAPLERQTVFVNGNFERASILDAAKKLGYTVEVVGEEK